MQKPITSTEKNFDTAGISNEDYYNSRQSCTATILHIDSYSYHI